MRGKRAKELRKAAFGEQGASQLRKYSVRLTEEEVRRAKRQTSGKLLLDHSPQRVDTGPRAVYQKLKKKYKEKKSGG